MSSFDGRLHLDLEEAGFPGQWVDMADIGAMSPEQFERFQLNAQSQTEESARAFLATVIKAWNITNPLSGEALPPPGSEGWSIKQIPLRVNKRIQENIQEQLADVLPKAP